MILLNCFYQLSVYYEYHNTREGGSINLRVQFTSETKKIQIIIVLKNLK